MAPLAKEETHPRVVGGAVVESEMQRGIERGSRRREKQNSRSKSP